MPREGEKTPARRIENCFAMKKEVPGDGDRTAGRKKIELLDKEERTAARQRENSCMMKKEVLHDEERTAAL